MKPIRLLFSTCADIPSEVAESVLSIAVRCVLVVRCHIQGAVMPRRKKTWMLLRGRSGKFIVVNREWYDFTNMAKHRGRYKSWWIVAESNDHGAMQAMAGLTGNYLKMQVNHEEDGIVTRRE